MNEPVVPDAAESQTLEPSVPPEPGAGDSAICTAEDVNCLALTLYGAPAHRKFFRP